VSQISFLLLWTIVEEDRNNVISECNVRTVLKFIIGK
jgi:hypothetical protein